MESTAQWRALGGGAFHAVNCHTVACVVWQGAAWGGGGARDGAAQGGWCGAGPRGGQVGGHAEQLSGARSQRPSWHTICLVLLSNSNFLLYISLT